MSIHKTMITNIPEFSLERTFKNRDLLLQTRSQFSKHALGEMIEAYEKIISKVQEDDLAVTWCTLRKIRQLMEEIK